MVCPRQVIVGVITNMLPRPELPVDCLCPQALAALMQKCWQHDASLRPGFNSVLDALETIAADEGLAIT